jgi:hypothetical protein
VGHSLGEDRHRGAVGKPTPKSAPISYAGASRSKSQPVRGPVPVTPVAPGTPGMAPGIPGTPSIWLRSTCCAMLPSSLASRNGGLWFEKSCPGPQLRDTLCPKLTGVWTCASLSMSKGSAMLIVDAAPTTAHRPRAQSCRRCPIARLVRDLLRHSDLGNWLEEETPASPSEATQTEQHQTARRSARTGSGCKLLPAQKNPRGKVNVDCQVPEPEFPPCQIHPVSLGQPSKLRAGRRDLTHPR